MHRKSLRLDKKNYHTEPKNHIYEKVHFDYVKIYIHFYVAFSIKQRYHIEKLEITKLVYYIVSCGIINER